MNSSSRRVLNTMNTLHNQVEMNRVYNCYNDVYRVQNIHVRDPFSFNSQASAPQGIIPKQKHMPTSSVGSAANPEEQEQNQYNRSPEFQQQQPPYHNNSKDERGSSIGSASASSHAQNQLDSDNIYVQYQLGQRKAITEQAQPQHQLNASSNTTRKSNLLVPSSSVSDMHSSNRVTPKNTHKPSLTSKDSIQASLASTAEKIKQQRKPWGSPAVSANGNASNQKLRSSQKKQQFQDDKELQYPPRELSTYSATDIQGPSIASAPPKHIYLSLVGNSAASSQGIALAPTSAQSENQSHQQLLSSNMNRDIQQTHIQPNEYSNNELYYSSQSVTELQQQQQQQRRQHAKDLSLQGSAEKAKVVESILSAKKSAIEIREKKRKPTEGSEGSTNSQQNKPNNQRQAQLPQPPVYKPTFISESNIYLIEQKKFEDIIQQQQQKQQQQQQQQKQQTQLQHLHSQYQFQSMPQSPSSGHVKSSTVQFPSMDSLVNSAKERQNYDFIAGQNERTITIRSKENSFNQLSSTQQLALSASKGGFGSGGLSVFSSNRSMVESLAYRAQVKSPEGRSPKTQLSDAQFLGKETMQERNEFWISHTQQHKHMLGEHYQAQEMRECTFSPTFFTNNATKKASVSHKNIPDRVDQSLNPTFHRAVQKVKESYQSLHLFKKETGYSIAIN